MSSMEEIDRIEYWRRSSDEARKNFTIVGDFATDCVRVVTAEADNCTLYKAAATYLVDPHQIEACHAEIIVSVLSPYQTCYTLQQGGELHPAYVIEKFTPRDRNRENLNGGDITALTMLIAELTGKKALVE